MSLPGIHVTTRRHQHTTIMSANELDFMSDYTKKVLYHHRYHYDKTTLNVSRFFSQVNPSRKNTRYTTWPVNDPYPYGCTSFFYGWLHAIFCDSTLFITINIGNN